MNIDKDFLMGLLTALEGALDSAGVQTTTGQRSVILVSLSEWWSNEQAESKREKFKVLADNYPLEFPPVPIECELEYGRLHGGHRIDTPEGPAYCPGLR